MTRLPVGRGGGTRVRLRGHAAGVKTCAVTWGAHDKAALAASAPDFVVEDVAALQRLLLA